MFAYRDSAFNGRIYLDDYLSLEHFTCRTSSDCTIAQDSRVQRGIEALYIYTVHNSTCSQNDNIYDNIKIPFKSYHRVNNFENTYIVIRYIPHILTLTESLDKNDMMGKEKSGMRFSELVY